MFVLMLLGYKGFLPPLLSVLPQGQNRILPGGAENFFAPSGAILLPLKMFSAPAKINPAHATGFRYLLYEQIVFYENECRIMSLEGMNEGATQK